MLLGVEVFFAELDWKIRSQDACFRPPSTEMERGHRGRVFRNKVSKTVGRRRRFIWNQRGGAVGHVVSFRDSLATLRPSSAAKLQVAIPWYMHKHHKDIEAFSETSQSRKRHESAPCSGCGERVLEIHSYYSRASLVSWVGNSGDSDGSTESFSCK